ncbi:MAG: DUF2807 domain-containing protein [Bacteroidales bacterium]|nr:DUF2807 domain-containing protein [Bacteroidales bacterium]MCF8390863.1 DUF2807 domain-containing protein [Bacteroidales bacterium]
MRYRLFLVPLLTLFLSLQSCYDFMDNGISGNGNVISEMRTVKDFHGIDAAAGLKVFVEFGEMSNEVEVLADENLHEYIECYVEGGILKIKTSKNIRNAESKEIYVKAGDIDHLEASSASRIIGIETLKTSELFIEVSSAGNMEVDLIAEDIDVEVSSSGNADLSGEAENMRVNVSSAGDLNAFSLKVRNCNIDVSSAGNASVFVYGELIADASSAGSIKYQGNPQTKSLNKSSAGSISGD